MAYRMAQIPMTLSIGGAYQGLGGAKPPPPKFLTVFCIFTVITLLVLS